MTTLGDVCEDIRRISYATRIPLLVDADTGWGGAFMIGRTVREMTRAGAAGCHIEDQVGVKRCGHRPGKALVETAEMVDRIKAAVDGRNDPQVRCDGAYGCARGRRATGGAVIVRLLMLRRVQISSSPRR